MYEKQKTHSERISRRLWSRSPSEGVECDSVAVNRDFQGGRFLKKEDKGKKGTF